MPEPDRRALTVGQAVPGEGEVEREPARGPDREDVDDEFVRRRPGRAGDEVERFGIGEGGARADVGVETGFEHGRAVAELQRQRDGGAGGGGRERHAQQAESVLRHAVGLGRKGDIRPRRRRQREAKLRFASPQGGERRGVHGQRAVLHGVHERDVGGIQFGLDVAAAGGDGHGDVVLRHHQRDLPGVAVPAEAVVAAHPELEAIALVPVGRTSPGDRGVLDLLARGHGDVVARDELPPVPDAALEPELRERGDLLDAQPEAPPADVDAVGVALPRDFAEAQRIEEPRPQVFRNPQARDLLDHRGEHERRAGVVGELHAGLVRQLVLEEAAHPVAPRIARLVALQRAAGVAGGHREQMAERDPPHALGDLRREAVRKEVDEPVVDGEQPLALRDADGGGDEALAQREELMRCIGGMRSPMAFGDDLAMPQQQIAVHAVAVPGEGVERLREGLGGARGDALGFRRRTDKRFCNHEGMKSSRRASRRFRRLFYPKRRRK